MRLKNELAALFQRRDRVAAQLADIDVKIADASLRYQREKGYLFRPRVEVLRQEVSA